MTGFCCIRCEDDRIHAGLQHPLYRSFPMCSTCGNKRCPHATDHRLDCTGSNEPGQPGSVYQYPPVPENGDTQ